MYHNFELPWLKKNEKIKLHGIIEQTIVRELEKRHWGHIVNVCSGSPCIFINDYRGLMLATGALRYHLNQFSTGLLYRGQVKDYSLTPSLYRKCKTKNQFEENEVWIELLIKEIANDFDPLGTESEREGLLQHYGLKTRWLDVLDHIQTALWFAYYDEQLLFNGDCIDDSVGYIYLLTHPRNIQNWANVFDLRLKPSDWMRPHVQQAYVIQLSDPTSYGRNLSHLNIMKIIIPRELIKKWGNIEIITKDIIYPGPAFDKALYYLDKGKKRLTSLGIKLTPPNS